VFICCDTCRDTLDVVFYDRDPPLHGWTKQKPRFAPGLNEWRCPECLESVEKRKALAAEEQHAGEMDVSEVALLVQNRDRVSLAVRSGKARGSGEWLESFYSGYRGRPGRVAAREGTVPVRAVRLPSVSSIPR